MSSVIERWHKVVEAQNPSGLADLLADDVVFHSPVVHTPQVARQLRPCICPRRSRR
ncbi:nuclear transport factor 2 family protein [Halopseudomonas pachastrellae]|nr:nuclear transport factor 2 family protein [Halopseudomonas pachastrellae]